MKILFKMLLVNALLLQIVNAQTINSTQQTYVNGDGNNWYINGTGNGPSILLRQHSGLGGPVNRRGALSWMDNNSGRYDILTWTDAGNIGIGTTNPQARLHVTGTIYGESNLKISGGIEANGGANNIFGWGTNPSWDIRAFGQLPYMINHHTGLTLSAHSAYGGIRLYNQSYTDITQSTMVMAVTNDKVGIGVANPTFKLHVAGDIYTTSNAKIDGDIIKTGGPDNIFGWGTNPSWDIRTFGQLPYIINHHTGLTFSAHSDYGGIRFYNQSYPNIIQSELVMSITKNNVGIGTTNPTEKLSVNGNIRAKKLIVTQNGWPDYVFSRNYKLRPIAEVADYIQANKHLPDMPSAKDVVEKGLDIGKTQAALLKKIEELTLYVIELKKENIAIKQENKVVNARLQKLEKKNK